MPLVYYHEEFGNLLGVWRADEPEAFFAEKLSQIEYPCVEGQAINHPEKRLQWYASRHLLNVLHPEAITRYAGRKPGLRNGPAISITHSGLLAGVMVADRFAGLDLQWPDPKLEAVAPKFALHGEAELLPFESSVERLAGLWAIKEAIFKHYGTRMPFRQMELTQFDPHTATAQVHIHRNGKFHTHALRLITIEGSKLAYLLPARVGVKINT